MNRSGLKKVTRTVRGKHGSVRRSYWVKAQEGAKNVGQKIWRNKGKIALAGAAIAGGLYLRHRKEAAYQAKDREIREAARVADFRADATQSLRNAGIHFGYGKSPGAFSRDHAKHSTRAESPTPSRSNPSDPFQLGPGADYKPAKPKRSRKKK